MSGLLPPDADDRDVALAANRLDAVLITKDADFLDLKARGGLRGALVWLRCGNMSNRRTAQILLPAVPGIVATIAAGESVVEIR
jgi:predicted nuclease of predicted toxin-antitoxin system